MQKWHRKQKQHHKKLYLEYRKKEVIQFIGIFLAVNHPKWAEDNFIKGFLNNELTVRQMFASAIVCGGQVAYFAEFPYQSDMKRWIGFMKLRHYINIK